jgi:hypothetical protein
MFPPSVAVVLVIDVAEEVVTVGADALDLYVTDMV